MRLPARSAKTFVMTAVAAAALAGLSGCGSSGPEESSTTKAASTTATSTLIATGLRSLEAGDTEAAAGSFRAVLELEPHNAYAHYNLGYIAQVAGKKKEALRAYDAALKSNPTFTSALYNKAYLTESTDLDAAIALYRQVVASDPNQARAYMRLGFALLHQGSKAEGEKALAEGIKIDPSMTTVTAPDYRDE